MSTKNKTKFSILQFAQANIMNLDVDNLPIKRATKYIGHMDYYNVPQIVILLFYFRDLQLKKLKERSPMEYKEKLNMTKDDLLIESLLNNVRFLCMNLCLKYMAIKYFKIRGSELSPNAVDNANYACLLSYIFINVVDILIYFLAEKNDEIAKEKWVQIYIKIKKLSYLFKTSIMSLTISIWIIVRYYSYLYKAFVWSKDKIMK